MKLKLNKFNAKSFKVRGTPQTANKRRVAQRVAKQKIEDIEPILHKLLNSQGKPSIFGQDLLIQKTINMLKRRIAKKKDELKKTKTT